MGEAWEGGGSAGICLNSKYVMKSRVKREKKIVGRDDKRLL